MAQVSFKVDDAIKEKAQKVCSSMGISMSTALNIFLSKVANERRIPFDVSIDPFYSEENMKRLRRSIRDLEEGHICNMKL